MGAAAHLQVFAILQAVDLALTVLVLRLGFRAIDPGAAGLAASGWPMLLAFKLLLLAGVVTWLVLHGGRAWSRTMQLLNGVCAGIVGWNLAVLLGQSAWTFGLVAAGVYALLPALTVLAMAGARHWSLARLLAESDRLAVLEEEERAWQVSP